jgi:hypothetical protein
MFYCDYEPNKEPMMASLITLNIRGPPGSSNWIVDALRPDLRTEQLIGVFTSRQSSRLDPIWSRHLEQYLAKHLLIASDRR